MTGVREERVDEAVQGSLKLLEPAEAEARELASGIDYLRTKSDALAAGLRQMHEAELGKLQGRLERLTDAYLDGTIEKHFFDEQRERLMLRERQLRENVANPADGTDIVERIENNLELGTTAWLSYQTASAPERREIVEIVTSNRALTPNGVSIEPSLPFALLARRPSVSDCRHSRDVPRTDQKLARAAAPQVPFDVSARVKQLPDYLRVPLEAMPQGWLRQIVHVFAVFEHEKATQRKAA